MTELPATYIVGTAARGEVIPSRVKLTLPMPPSANRYWRNYRGVTVLSDEARAYKAEVGWMSRGIVIFRGNVAVGLHVYRERKAGDLDNRIKVILDSLQGYVYENDSAVVEIHAYRHDDKANPRVEVEIWEV